MKPSLPFFKPNALSLLECFLGIVLWSIDCKAVQLQSRFGLVGLGPIGKPPIEPFSPICGELRERNAISRLILIIEGKLINADMPQT